MKLYAHVIARVETNKLCTGQSGYLIIIMNTCVFIMFVLLHLNKIGNIMENVEQVVELIGQ